MVTVAPEPLAAARRAGPCPKHMVHGPCGGVRAGGSCEVDAELRCPFVDRALVEWSGGPPPPPARRNLLAAEEGPVVIADLHVRPYDRGCATAVASTLGEVTDAVLVGDHATRPDYPAPVLLPLLAEAGAVPWFTLACRDRNRVVLEEDAAGLALVGAAGVHCVTGDARGPGARPDATQVFDVDALELVALVRAAGLPVSVAEAPAATPAALRPGRLREKERAGAEVAILNHCGPPEAVATFVAAARDAGCTVPAIAALAVVTDERCASALRRFPGLALDEEQVHRSLGGTDPVRDGIAAAVDAGRRLLLVRGVVGVNLSGMASSASEEASAELMAEVAEALRR